MKNRQPDYEAGEKTSASDLMRDFAVHLMMAREAERKHLASEIHDKLGQNLLALRIDVSMLHARTIERHPRINSRAGNLLTDLDIAIQNVRDIINHLQPPVLALGLLASVEWKVREFEKYSRIPCALLIEGDDHAYQAYDGHAMLVVRILHEALTNVARHASARNVDVSVSNAERDLKIKVYDDGVGLQPDDLNKPNTFGLLGIKEYARMLSGQFAIGDGQPRGTVLSVTIPPAPIAA
jgi:signal transduction histidine kinase